MLLVPRGCRPLQVGVRSARGSRGRPREVESPRGGEDLARTCRAPRGIYAPRRASVRGRGCVRPVGGRTSREPASRGAPLRSERRHRRGDRPGYVAGRDPGHLGLRGPIIAQDVDIPDSRQSRPNARSTREPKRTAHRAPLDGDQRPMGVVGEPGTPSPIRGFVRSRPLVAAIAGPGLVTGAQPSDQGAPGAARDRHRHASIEPEDRPLATRRGGMVFRRSL